MYILFDIGGTNMRLASSDGKRVLAIKKVKTPQKFKEGMKIFKEISDELSKGKKIRGVIGGIAGPLDVKKECLIYTPNISADWKGRNIKKTIEKMCMAPSVLENDTALVGLGEAVYGAGKGQEIVAYITISTGVGGVRIVHNTIDENAFGFEPGHQIIGIRGEKKEKLRTLEQCVQGKAIKRRTGKNPEEVKDKKFWDEIAQLTAYGMHNVSVFWSPNIIVLGGGVMKNIPIGAVKKYLKKILVIFGGKIPKVQRAQLGDDNGLYGALALLRQLRKNKVCS